MHKNENDDSKHFITAENFQSICRICFSEGNLYDTRCSKYENYTISELFSILINEQELDIAKQYEHIVYPQFLCYGCIHNLIFIKIFIDQCYKAHKTLSKVYNCLTLYQHNTVIISNRVCVNDKDNMKIMQRCKLEQIKLKRTLQLEKAFLRSNNDETNCNNDSTADSREGILEESLAHELNKKQTVELNLESTKKSPVSLVTENDQIIANSDKDMKGIDLDLHVINKTSTELIKNSTLQEIKETIESRKRLRIGKTQTSTKMPRIQPKSDNWWEDSDNCQKYRNNFNRIKQGLEPNPSDFFTNNNFNPNDKFIKELQDMYTKNQQQRVAKNIHNVDKLPDSSCQNINSSVDIAEKRQTDSCACPEPIELIKQHLDQFENENADKSDFKQAKTLERMDTMKLYQALLNINRDKKNIDLDHCYTNMNVYRNVRYILPRVNFRRANDLLYPDPDIMRTKDKILAGNISKRMASILKGDMSEKSRDINKNTSTEDVVKIETISSGDLPVEMQVQGQRIEVKIEEFDSFEERPAQELISYVKPEYINIDEDYDCFRDIKEEPEDLFDMIEEENIQDSNEMDFCENSLKQEI